MELGKLAEGKLAFRGRDFAFVAKCNKLMHIDNLLIWGETPLQKQTFD